MASTRAALKSRPDVQSMRGDRQKLNNHMRHMQRAHVLDQHRHYDDDEDDENENVQDNIIDATTTTMKMDVVPTPSHHANCALPVSALDARKQALVQWKQQKELRDKQKRGLVSKNTKAITKTAAIPVAAVPKKPTTTTTTSTKATTTAASKASTTTSVAVAKGKITASKALPAAKPVAKASVPAPQIKPVAPAKVVKAAVKPIVASSKLAPTKMAATGKCAAKTSKQPTTTGAKKNLDGVFPSASEVNASVIDNLITDFSFASPAPRTATPKTSSINIVSSASINTPLVSQSIYAQFSAVAPSPLAAMQVEESAGVKYLNIMLKQKEDLLALVAEWTQEMEGNACIPDGVVGDINSAIGKAMLLCNSRFKQFAKICGDSDDVNAAKTTTATDLTGFWELIMIQVDDVLGKFNVLKEQKSRNYAAITTLAPKKAAKKTAKADVDTEVTIKADTAKISARERFLKFKAAKAQQSTEDAPVSTSVLVPVMAPSSVRKSMGAAIVLTPCRRSARKTPSSYRRSLGVVSVSRLLEQTSYSYVPNEYVQDTIVSPEPQVHSNDNDDPLAKYLFGTPAPTTAPPTTPRSTMHVSATPLSSRLASLTPAKSTLKPIYGSNVLMSAQRVPLSVQFDDINSLF